jgi:NAD(P)-dependent dehydrogenase (short-subunit alcohol dehydrogenase family)
VMRTNLDSLYNMTKQVADGMVERGWGRVINISSVNGSKGAFGQTNYSAAKAGVHGFTKALALEVAKKNVTVNTISPGYIGTKMVTAIPQEVLDTKILPQIPLGRLGSLRDRREYRDQWGAAHAVGGCRSLPRWASWRKPCSPARSIGGLLRQNPPRRSL